MAGLGIGPVGLAFYAWDIGMKQGDVRLLGVAAYAAPVLSTLLLVLAGFAAPSLTLALACLCRKLQATWSSISAAALQKWLSYRLAV